MSSCTMTLHSDTRRPAGSSSPPCWRAPCWTASQVWLGELGAPQPPPLPGVLGAPQPPSHPPGVFGAPHPPRVSAPLPPPRPARPQVHLHRPLRRQARQAHPPPPPGRPVCLTITKNQLIRLPQDSAAASHLAWASFLQSSAGSTLTLSSLAECCALNSLYMQVS